MRYLLLVLIFLFAGHASATGEINVLTDLKSPFPPGCVAVSLPQDPDGNDHITDAISVPSVDADQPAATVNITIWRVGCHDQGYSVVMVRLEKLSGGPVLVPRVFAEKGEVGLPLHQAQLIRHPAVGDVGASGNELVGTTTYMLAVDPFHPDPSNDSRFWPEHYNDAFTLELYWGDFKRTDRSLHYRLFTIFEYDPQLDLPQTDYPPLHGRMSGQYTVEGLPYAGLFMQIGEEANPNGPDTNSITATFFTYMNGEPFWVIGSEAGLEPGFESVTLDMLELHGGEFIAVAPGSYTEDDVEVSSMGTMTIEALDCNRLLIGYDFTDSGFGSGSFEADRLIRTAGYDCNPWQ